MDLYYFNPGCELEVAFGSPTYTLQKNPKILEHDLSTIPMCFAQKGDIVVSDTKDEDYKQFWGLMLGVRFAPINSPEVRKAQFGKFVPWGISPRILHIISKLNFSAEYSEGCVGKWSSLHSELFSRETSAKFFQKLIEKYGNADLFPTSSELPIVARDINEASQFFNKARDSRFHGSVFKATYGSSGRGIKIFRNNLMTENIITWTNFVLRTQGSLTCEYLFDKLEDFSMHYQIENGKARFVGVSSFSTASNGAYESSLVKRLDSIPSFDYISAKELSEMHLDILNQSIFTQIYSGPLGIDCMVYRDPESKYGIKINPCIEINCRHSMGRLAMEISKIVAPDCHAEYHVFQKNYPIAEYSQNAIWEDGKLIGGFLPLTPKDTQMFCAGIRVERGENKV